MDISPFYKTGLDENILEFNHFIHRMDLEGSLLADHVGYRCDSSEQYSELRSLLINNGKLFDESRISGRRISIFILWAPLRTVCGLIKYFELVEKKPGQIQRACFDHIEVFPKKVSDPENVAAYLRKRGIHVIDNDRPHHPTKDVQLSANFRLCIEKERLAKTIQARRRA